MMEKFFILAATLLFASASYAQLPPPAPGASQKGESRGVRGWPSITTLPADPGFVSLTGRFRVTLPTSIQGFRALSPKQLGTNASGQEITWKFQDAEILGVFVDFPDADWDGSAETMGLIASNSKRLLMGRMPSAKLVSEKFSSVNGVPSVYYILDAGEKGFVAVNIFVDKKRLYSFTSVFMNRSHEETIIKVFKSFSLITQAEVDEELRKKYAELKPVPLPQVPVVVRLSSDAMDAGLKGKVKQVTTESEDRSGTASVQGRKMSSVEYYDERGARTQRDSYDSQGNPFMITVYGYIDGKRVSNSKLARYEYDPPPATGPPPAAKGAQPAESRDPRYEYSYEYKYENGNLVERQMIYNNGRKGMRYVYKHSPDRVEELVYSADGKLNQRYLSILDDKGNQVERTDFGVVNFEIYGDRKYKYTYVIDDNGNWVKRTTFKEVTANGVTEWQPLSESYRTIVYY
jgi:hypothetical protein